MFFPFRDENPTERVPFVNYGLMAANVVVFLYLWPIITAGSWWLLPGYGLVPTRISADPAGEAFTILTSMFMHGGWGHLLSNMLFLHIFGDNLEDVMGHWRYLAFYLGCGLAAALAQTLIDTHSQIPMLGASGAIAGVVGGYLLLFPKAPIVMLNLTPLIFFIGLLPVIPAWAVAGEFFIVNAWQALSASGESTGETGGVAVFAHLGGFIAGFLLTKPFLGGRSIGPRQWRSFQSGPRSAPAPGTARWRRRPRRPEE
jgi:membrane associated rhomboid family serine protease